MLSFLNALCNLNIQYFRHRENNRSMLRRGAKGNTKHITLALSQPGGRHGSTRVHSQAIPSLREVAHDASLCTFTMEIPSARSWAAPVRATGTVRRRQAVRYSPSITYKITPAGSLSSCQPGGPPCLGQPTSIRPHWSQLIEVGGGRGILG